METFTYVSSVEEFYGLLQSEAMLLQKKYQPALRDDQEVGHEFIRCPNCTLVLNSININPLTDNQDFLKEGVPQIQKEN